MFCKSFCCAITGVEACIVQIEADVSEGMPVFNLVGMLSSEVKEARERVRSAVRNLGIRFPPKRITLNMSPADIRKAGTAFDLSVSFALMGAFGNVPVNMFGEIMFIGELSLDGHINRVNGVLPMVIAARDNGFKYCIVPDDNVSEGILVSGIGIIGVSTLEAAVDIIKEGRPELHTAGSASWNPPEAVAIAGDYADVSGQHMVKRAAEISAAGRHNLLMIGAPGAGKTMIAQRIPGILPPMTREESIEVSKIYSVCGELDVSRGYMYTRPFRAPHHSIPRTGLIGGGNYPHPGEISLSHKGVLFLDELTEFQRDIIELLRQPLESNYIIHTRNNVSIKYPSDFMLVAAANPCPCGYYPDRSRCICTESKIRRYRSRISHAFLDRIDIVVNVKPISYASLGEHNDNEHSYDIRERVVSAHNIQKERYKGTEYRYNSELDAAGIRKWCNITDEDREYLERIYDRLGLSARSYHKLMKIARTIADIEGVTQITRSHLAEAVYYKQAETGMIESGGAI